MVEFRGTGYWLSEHGLLMSSDKGATWSVAGPTPKGECLGHVGHHALSMVVGSPDGLYESKTAARPGPLPFRWPLRSRYKRGQVGQLRLGPDQQHFLRIADDQGGVPVHRQVTPSLIEGLLSGNWRA